MSRRKGGKKLVGYNPDAGEIVEEEVQREQKQQPYTKGRRRAEMQQQQQQQRRRKKGKGRIESEEDEDSASDGEEQHAVEGAATGGDDDDDGVVPVQVTYCPMCRMPVEYCEFSNVFESKCMPWMEEAVPDMLQQLLQLREDDKYKSKKISKRKVDDQGDKKGKTEAAVSGAAIRVTVTQRTKRKWATLITGLEQFGINVRDLSKVLSRRFSSGASVVKKPETGIECQGDFGKEIFDVLCAEPYKVPRGAIKVEVKRKKTREEKMEAALARQAELMLGGREAVQQLQEEAAAEKMKKKAGGKKRGDDSDSD